MGHHYITLPYNINALLLPPAEKKSKKGEAPSPQTFSLRLHVCICVEPSKIKSLHFIFLYKSCCIVVAFVCAGGEMRNPTGGQMSTAATLINPDQTSPVLSQCCHSVKQGQEYTLLLCNSPLSNQSCSPLGPSSTSEGFIVSLCSRLLLLQHLKV